MVVLGGRSSQIYGSVLLYSFVLIRGFCFLEIEISWRILSSGATGNVNKVSWVILSSEGRRRKKELRLKMFLMMES
uniref:Uncharacterized protein n=1 Tax=Helianthus annuus TaxID=4232 RepID=A0A251VEY5_HELAN